MKLYKLRALTYMYMGYWPSVRSRWLDIDLALFCVFMDLESISVHKLTEKDRGQYPAILTTYKLGQ